MSEETSYPTFETAIIELVRVHREETNEPVRFALYYEPQNGTHPKGDVYLFEVIEGFGDERVDEDKRMMEVWYGATEAFPLHPGQHLRMMLTNPTEFQIANEERWTDLQVVRKAVEAEKYRVIYSMPNSSNLLEMLK